MVLNVEGSSPFSHPKEIGIDLNNLEETLKHFMEDEDSEGNDDTDEKREHFFMDRYRQHTIPRFIRDVPFY